MIFNLHALPAREDDLLQPAYSSEALYAIVCQQCGFFRGTATQGPGKRVEVSRIWYADRLTDEVDLANECKADLLRRRP